MLAAAEVDTLIINGGPNFAMGQEWSADRTREGKVSVYGMSPEALRQRRELTRWITTILAGEHYDFIVAQYLDLALLVPRKDRARMIFDPDDFLKTAPPGAAVSMLVRIKIQVRNMLARRVARQALHVWYASPKPGDLPNNARRSFMPNVVSVPDPTRDREAPVAGRLLMVGLFAHEPNIEGLRWFADHVWPALSARFPFAELHVIGRHGPDLPEQIRAAHFHGFVKDLAAEYDRAAVVVAPIRSGGGTQIKVIDALVHARPLVSSTFAYSGFAADLKLNDHMLAADSAAQWIDACTSLLNDSDATEGMARRGAEKAAATYGPERMVTEVRSTLASVGH
ncbi:hypothetical protein ASG67_03850 [Sphingomonas sp. Leaf339]|nr:hypothetical protein ASG67_03850 [Sphingomonas sp. Leaf339]